jgi:hypothetical protein
MQFMRSVNFDWFDGGLIDPGIGVWACCPECL